MNEFCVQGMWMHLQGDSEDRSTLKCRRKVLVVRNSYVPWVPWWASFMLYLTNLMVTLCSKDFPHLVAEKKMVVAEVINTVTKLFSSRGNLPNIL